MVEKMLTYTGERIIPKLMQPTNGMLLEHIARYHFSFLYAQGRVLDIACGVGYGTQMIAKAKKHEVTEVLGVDLDEETITYAKANYYHPLVKYQQASAADRSLPKLLGQFDTIISFETLEHLQEEKQFLNNLYHLLKPGGTLIISTPFGQGRGKPTLEPFHVHQLTVQEFKELFMNFEDVSFYGQRGVLIEPLEQPNRNIHLPIGIAVCKK